VKTAECAELLLESRCSANHCDKHGKTALMTTCKNLAVLDALVAAGGDVNIEDSVGGTCYRYAAQCGFRKACRFLVGECGATGSDNGATQDLLSAVDLCGAGSLVPACPACPSTRQEAAGEEEREGERESDAGTPEEERRGQRRRYSLEFFTPDGEHIERGTAEWAAAMRDLLKKHPELDRWSKSARAEIEQ